MELINQITNYLQDFARESQATYHVNPWIFLILFFGSAIPLYFGYFLIARSALKYEDHKIKRKTIDKRQLRLGIFVAVFAWWIPYVYVIVFGKLPMHLWLLFFAFVLVMGIFFVFALNKRISEAKEAKGE